MAASLRKSRPMGPLEPFLCCFCTILLLAVTNAINLDARFSVIKKGDKDSYFGYSVAQHQILDPSNRVTDNVLFIGSPKKIRKLGNEDSGGALYRCDAKSASDSDCTIIDDGISYAPTTGEVVKDQWLGVTVASQGAGKKAVACAHRYIKDNAAVGVCYQFSSEMSFKSSFQPCYTYTPHTKYMEDFGLCQAGMSVAIGQDDAFVVGAPGSIFWQGVIFLTNVTEELGVPVSVMESPYKSPGPTLEVGEQPTPTNRYTYNGYSLTMGRFDGTKAMYYASGAPKSQNSGEVVFFREYPKGKLRYEPDQIIRGPLVFSGFGSTLVAVDLNNDGFDDLIVGAPYYYKRQHGGAFYVYLGRNSMITSSTKSTEVLSRTMSDSECNDLLCEHARFGMSLAKLGDINMDSYQDFAVGAPYEGNGAVYIYHGSNAEEGFKTDYAQRIIASDLPVPGISSFGHALSGGMDLDNNGYPDLLVGSYESDAVALIRSRPIIKIIPSVSVSPEAVDLEAPAICNNPNVRPEYKNRRCVAVMLCLNFTTKPSDSINVIPRVIYSLEAEPQRKAVRAELQDAQDLGKKIVENKEITLVKSSDVCVTELALLKSNIEDKLNPIEFQFQFKLSTDSQEPTAYPDSSVQDVNLFPVLDTEGARTGAPNAVSVEAEFVKECGEDNLCRSNLQFDTSLKDLKKNDENVYEMVIKEKNYLHVTMRVKNEGEAAYLTRIYVTKPKLVTYVRTSSGAESDSPDAKTPVTCQGDTIIRCDQIGNPLRTGEAVYFVLTLNVPRSMSESAEIYNITALVNTSSSEETPISDQIVMNFRVINKAEIGLITNVLPDSPILCEGEPRGASAIENELDIGASVKHNFIVSNDGPGVVSESYINITWPYEVGGTGKGSGKFLLYLMRKPKITGPVIKCNDDEIAQYINPLGIKEVIEADDAETGAVSVDAVKSLEDGGSSRRRRSTDRERRASGNVVVMSCEDQSAKCFEYKCQLGKLEPRQNFVQITFEARLWESTLLSDYRKAADVQIISWGKITVPDKLMISQDTSDDKKRAITRSIPDFKETAGQTIQWWIILVAVLAGLIVLLVVIFILYKLGFFKRRRMEDMQMYKAEKKQQAMLTDYEDDGAL